MSFGDKLRGLRKGAGKSQSQVSREMTLMFPDFKISQAYVSALENREKAPRQDILDMFCAYFGVQLSTFFEDDALETYASGISIAEMWLNETINGTRSNRSLGHWTEQDDEIARNLQRLRNNVQPEDDYLEF